MVLLALDSDGLALEFASPELREDREVVLRAVKADGEALQFARVFQERFYFVGKPWGTLD